MLRTFNTSLNRSVVTAELIPYSVVIPVYNSDQTLRELHKRVTRAMTSLAGQYNYEIVFVDDASPVDCWTALRDLAANDCHVRAIQLSKNTGQTVATIAGISVARGSLVVTMDDDLQHPPEEIPRLVHELVIHPDCDAVIGVARERQHSWLRRVGSRAIDRINTLLIKKPSEIRFSGFRVLRGDIARTVAAGRQRPTALGPVLFSVTHRIRNVEFEHHPRVNGRSGYTFRKLLKQSLDNLTAFSIFPLRLLALTGLVGIVAAGLFFLVLMLRYFINGDTSPGFTTLAMLMTGLSGFNFFAFGIVGEYLIRLNDTGSLAPPLLIRAEIGSVNSFDKLIENTPQAVEDY